MKKEDKKYKKVIIGGKKRPKTYLPSNLSKEDKKKQIKSIVEKKDRPKLKSFQSKRSPWVEKFEKKYGTKITNKKFINDNILKNKGQEEILRKGRGAYYSSGSRPNQTASSWAYARLASALLGGPSSKIDAKILKQYKVKKKSSK